MSDSTTISWGAKLEPINLIMACAYKRAECKENFIACYIAHTGLKPQEIELVEERSDKYITWYCRPRGVKD